MGGENTGAKLAFTSNKRSDDNQEGGFRDFAESIVQHIDEVFFWCDADHLTPYYVSHAYEKIWRQPCESVYADPSSWLESIHSEDRDYVIGEFKRACTAGQLDLEYRIVRPGGDVRWIWARTFPIFTQAGAVRRLIGIAQDCTERKQNEKTRAFLASIVESSDDSIIGTDLNGTILSWNQAAVTLFGYTAEEAIGQHITLIFAPDRKADHLTTLSKIGRRELIERFESVRMEKGGKLIDVAVILSPIKDALGRLQGVSGIYRDITDRKRAEREKKLMEIQLQHAQKMESIGRLAAGIAHEINTPTQYIGDNLTFLKEAFFDLERVLRNSYALFVGSQVHDSLSAVQPDALEPAREVDIDYLLKEIPQALDQSLDGVSRVSTLVGAMRDFSHPGKKEKIPTNLNIAIESTITVARNEWKYVAELETDYDTSLPLVPCLTGDFNQVILNLIVNAAHAVAGAAKNGQRGMIIVRTRNCPPWAEVQIQDTGTGIPEEIRSRIFEPFFTTKEVGQGTGQGLAIAHSVVVEKHGGDIHFHTEMGKGTTFIIRLPLA